MQLTLTPRRWEMVAPFVTAGETVNHIDVLHVMFAHEGFMGRAETMGVDYLGRLSRALRLSSRRSTLQRSLDLIAKRCRPYCPRAAAATVWIARCGI